MAAEFENGHHMHLSPVDPGVEYEEDFGLVLKSGRNNAKLSQGRLARRTGFDHSHVSRLESGAREPSRDAVEILAEALELDQVQADRLRASAGFRGEGNTISHNETEMLALNALLENPNLSEEARARMRAVLSALVDMVLRHYFVQEPEV